MNKVLYLFITGLSITTSLVSAQSSTVKNNIILAEVDFAKAAEKSGLKYAFEKNLDSSGVIASGVHLVNGLKAYAKAKPENHDLLVWYPSLARTNSSGSFGFTTGPYLYYSRRGTPPNASGNYFSIWKKDHEMNSNFFLTEESTIQPS